MITPTDRTTTAAGPWLGRRSFLAGLGGLALAAACGSNGQGGTAATTAAGGAISGTLALGVTFPPSGLLHTGAEQRLPLLLFVDGFPADFDQAPATIELGVSRQSGAPGTTVAVARRGTDVLPRPYYALVHTFDDTGTWYVSGEVDGQMIETAVEVGTAEETSVLTVGSTMPAIITPTFDDPAGVDPICTRDPVCPLHDVTVADALDLNRPVAVLVSSPAFCQTAVCGPVLDLVLAEAGGRTDIGFLHAEVFANPTADPPTAAPVMDELGLGFEPSLFLVGADRVLRQRLDASFDTDELAAALDSIAG